MSNRTQQEAVYAAENALSGYGRRFKDIREVRAYLADLTGTDWWIDRYGEQLATIGADTLRSQKWAGTASRGRLAVNIARQGRNEATVLHEVAHLITSEEEGHGPVFCHTLLVLVRERMGFFAWADLEGAFRRAGCLDGRHLDG